MASQEPDSQELIDALMDEGYTLPEIAFIVYGLQSREVDALLQEKKAQQTRLGPIEKFNLGALAIATQCSNATYGQRAVAAMAAAFHLKEDSLYDCIFVAKLWSAKEFEALVAKTGPFGYRLSFSHFVTAARWAKSAFTYDYHRDDVHNEQRRRIVQRQAKCALDTCLELRLSVRELKNTLDSTK